MTPTLDWFLPALAKAVLLFDRVVPRRSNNGSPIALTVENCIAMQSPGLPQHKISNNGSLIAGSSQRSIFEGVGPKPSKNRLVFAGSSQATFLLNHCVAHKSKTQMAVAHDNEASFAHDDDLNPLKT